MKMFTAGCAIILLLSSISWAQLIPPINLTGELLNGGQVELTWEEPPDGIFEDFEDGVAQGFEFDQADWWTIEDGFAKVATPEPNMWGSGWYAPLSFTQITAEVTFQNQVGDLSRGMLFFGDGAHDGTYNGYGFWIAYTITGFSVWKYTNGSGQAVLNWTTSNLINTEPGQYNTLKIEAADNSFELYVNDVYVNTVMDDTHTSGYTGMVSAYSNTVWFDEFSAIPAVTPDNPEQQPQTGEPIPYAVDHMGRIIDPNNPHEPDLMMAPEWMVNRPAPGSTRELDEFIEYRIYRDGELIGTSDIEQYTDTLPAIGEYEYTVTALYDEGESPGAGPLLINWEPVYFTITGQQTVIPPGGGALVYGVSLQSTIGITIPGVGFWTSVTLPNGQAFGPLFNYTFTLMPFMDITVANLQQMIPGLAPTGDYQFHGHVGFYPQEALSDSFAFEKTGVATGGAFTFNPDQWKSEVPDFTASDNSASIVAPPAEYTLADVWPNPFNASANVAITLPEDAKLTVEIFNVNGQRVATLADGSYTAGRHTLTFDADHLTSGLYFVRASVPGQLNQVRKMMLVR